MSQISPIIDSIVEVRYDSTLPIQALVGILFQEFGSHFERIDDLPILQLPIEVRMNDPELKKQPQYRLVGQEFVVSVGEGLIAISAAIDRATRYYQGWEIFGGFAFKILDFLSKNGSVTTYSKIDVRYINYFEKEGITEKVNLDIKVAGKSVSQNLTVFFEDQAGDYLTKVQMASKANVQGLFVALAGTVVDIGATYEKPESNIGKVKEHINKLHDTVEIKFFEIVKTEFIPKGVTKKV